MLLRRLHKKKGTKDLLLRKKGEEWPLALGLRDRHAGSGRGIYLCVYWMQKGFTHALSPLDVSAHSSHNISSISEACSARGTSVNHTVRLWGESLPQVSLANRRVSLSLSLSYIAWPENDFNGKERSADPKRISTFHSPVMQTTPSMRPRPGLTLSHEREAL